MGGRITLQVYHTRYVPTELTIGSLSLSSCISVVLGPDFARCAEQMMPLLIALLPNSARVQLSHLSSEKMVQFHTFLLYILQIMASSAEVCIKFIIKVRNSVMDACDFL